MARIRLPRVLVLMVAAVVACRGVGSEYPYARLCSRPVSSGTMEERSGLVVWDEGTGVVVFATDGNTALYPSRRPSVGSPPYRDWVEVGFTCGDSVLRHVVDLLRHGSEFKACTLPPDYHVRIDYAGSTLEGVLYRSQGDAERFREDILSRTEACARESRPVPLVMQSRTWAGDYPLAKPWSGAQVLGDYVAEPRPVDDATVHTALDSLRGYEGVTTQGGRLYRVRVFPDSPLASLWSGVLGVPLGGGVTVDGTIPERLRARERP